MPPTTAPAMIPALLEEPVLDEPVFIPATPPLLVVPVPDDPPPEPEVPLPMLNGLLVVEAPGAVVATVPLGTVYLQGRRGWNTGHLNVNANNPLNLAEERPRS